MGIPLRVRAVAESGLAQCEDVSGTLYPQPIQTQLLDSVPGVGDWLLTHIDTAIRTLDPDEALLIANALQALQLAANGRDFEHLLADLVDREPELPAHLRRDGMEESASAVTGKEYELAAEVKP